MHVKIIIPSYIIYKAKLVFSYLDIKLLRANLNMQATQMPKDYTDCIMNLAFKCSINS